MTITVTPAEKAILDEALAAFADCQVLVFGSRVFGTHRPHSDLDLCLKRATALETLRLGALRERLEESNLPFKVDVVDYQRVSPSFQEVIDRTAVRWE